jgi:hypothetical protein
MASTFAAFVSRQEVLWAAKELAIFPTPSRWTLTCANQTDRKKIKKGFPSVKI